METLRRAVSGLRVKYVYDSVFYGLQTVLLYLMWFCRWRCQSNLMIRNWMSLRE